MSWLHDRLRRRKRRRPRRRRVWLEALEPRRLLSGSPLAPTYDDASAAWFGAEIVAAEAEDAASPREEERWIVRLTPDAADSLAQGATLGELLRAEGIDFRLERRLGLPGQLLVRASETDQHRVAAALASNPRVSLYERDQLIVAQQTPDDPHFDKLDALENAGQSGGVPGADIDALAAWDQTTGSADVIVAVIDSGVEHTHEDLADNIWVNPLEIADNGVDDDGNGFVDDVHGWNFHRDKTTDDPLDDNGKG